MNKLSPVKLEEIIRLRTSGMSLRDVSAATGVHKETIRKHTPRISRTAAMKRYHQKRKVGTAKDQVECEAAVLAVVRYHDTPTPENVIEEEYTKLIKWIGLVKTEANLLQLLIDGKICVGFGSGPEPIFKAFE